MNKNIYKLELILILGVLIIAGLTLFAIFSSPSSKFVKMIKWSDVESFSEAMDSTAKRLYPQLAESNHIRIEGYESITTLHDISLIINTVTGLKSKAISQPELIVLDSSKKQDIQLKIIFEKTSFKNIDQSKVFDEKSFKKIAKKYHSENNLRPYLFSLYQIKSNEYILSVYNLID